MNIESDFRRTRMRRVITFALGMAVTLMAFAKSAQAETPDLPAEIKQEAGAQQLTLLDFYSPFCGACVMMEPHVERLKLKAGDQLFYKRLDLTAPDNAKYMKSYGIEGTPTYVLFDASGKPIYRMEELISPSVLEKQVLRNMGKLDPVPIPPALLETVEATPVSQGSQMQNILLLAFKSKDCEPCREMAPYLQGFSMTGKEGLGIVEVDTDTRDGQVLMQTLAIKTLPTYVLLDNTNDSKEELIRIEGNVQPKDLWGVIRLFGQDGISEKHVMME